MHLNYHFLSYLCPALSEVFAGSTITSCFSQNKDEMIIETNGLNKIQFIRAHFLPPQIYLSFPENYQRAKRNTIDLFKEILGDTIISCKVLNFERAFYFQLKSGKILFFKLHANRSNVILYQKNAHKPSLLFRKVVSEDSELDWRTLEKSLDLSHEQFLALDGNASQFLPTLGTIPRNWLKENEYLESDLNHKWALMEEILDMLGTPLFSLIKRDGEVRLSLLPESEAIKSFSNPIEAVNELFYAALIRGNFEKDKSSLLKKYQETLRRHLSYVEKSTAKLAELKNAAPPSNLADVIMASLHLFEHGKNDIELVDFYTGENISVRLKPQQKPQDKAASLYRKNKNRKLEWDQLDKTITLKNMQAGIIQTKIEELEAIDDFRSLKNFKKLHGEDKVLQKEAQVLPFKTFESNGFAIWVGKSAQSNDDMLRGYTKKDDIWLHARMVAGSHVLVKTSGIKNIPAIVIETAAQLAAYYSKNKTETLAPVIYTEAKYVRKVKGSTPGSVLVEKEKVIMVTPKAPEEIFGNK
jgi:predicted ribosome quality control (RQC) complex YloA/Tae2 family protein